MQLVLGGFWLVSDCFCWFRINSDGFRWLADLVVTPISQHTEECKASGSTVKYSRRGGERLKNFQKHGHCWHSPGGGEK